MDKLGKERVTDSEGKKTGPRIIQFNFYDG